MTISASTHNKYILIFDADSTLVKIEGINELAKYCKKYDEVYQMTDTAMNGTSTIPFQELYKRRLDIIKPTLSQIKDLGQIYLNNKVAGVDELFAKINQRKIQNHICSGGILQALSPLANSLNTNSVFGVKLHFNEDGSFSHFDPSSETSQDYGKNKIVKQLKERHPNKEVIFIGDGQSDMETKFNPITKQIDSNYSNYFIAFTQVEPREKIMEQADFVATDMFHLESILNREFGLELGKRF
ncbi:HAD-IB family phosphatase [Candidatus Woesearchaeota archaeon]|jgi:phosphoserine phosphatase|nr:HAD-IB family phosphatase [Candidatus Woesearchaeota archaeon]MBT4387615.1 HAD-IB family phosphatase [Candidatus Woesearchaeota archaeon]MBT4596022.1 HAD-IB family phosphatase [Candidatus Woesearchaeota archaeon]MBT5740730.1 HAD-IB family phosphatase [Candidatus Woesearchaeota archaeon]MBT6506165.1 HAD-IB family phosphatase [Candidatus Woesearchaeota archaeon]